MSRFMSVLDLPCSLWIDSVLSKDLELIDVDCDIMILLSLTIKKFHHKL